MRSIELDIVDERILEQLQADASVSTAALAARVGLSEKSCGRRVTALEKAGVIRQYTVLLDRRVVDLGLTVFVYVRFDWRVKDGLEMIERTILEQPEILECYLLTGDAEYLLRIAVPDVPAYVRLLVDRLRRLPGLARLKSSFVFREIKRSTALPLSINVPAYRVSPIRAQRR
jgi:Lrp/AsnC family transcriptional regulator, leucine-responsive regulatory protein